jgi:hypothetical protein
MRKNPYLKTMRGFFPETGVNIADITFRKSLSAQLYNNFFISSIREIKFVVFNT